MSGDIVRSEIPPGYTVIVGPDKKNYIVPKFMMPSVEQTISTERIAQEIGIGSASGVDRRIKAVPKYNTIGGVLHIPPEPCLSNQERLMLHAEVLGLQERLGISYRDAAHRLYMAEIAKLKESDAHMKSMIQFDNFLTNSLKNIYKKYDSKGPTDHQ